MTLRLRNEKIEKTLKHRSLLKCLSEVPALERSLQALARGSEERSLLPVPRYKQREAV